MEDFCWVAETWKGPFKKGDTLLGSSSSKQLQGDEYVRNPKYNVVVLFLGQPVSFDMVQLVIEEEWAKN